MPFLADMEIKKTEIEGLYSVKDDGVIGPHHRKVTEIIDDVLGVAVHARLECGHTVVIINPEPAVELGRLVYCGECAGLK